MQFTFVAELWRWDARKSDTWTFVTVPPEASDDLRHRSGPPSGFGAIRVQVRIGGSQWGTSVLPDKESGCYVLPIKAVIRRAEGLAIGDSTEVHVTTA